MGRDWQTGCRQGPMLFEQVFAHTALQGSDCGAAGRVWGGCWSRQGAVGCEQVLQAGFCWPGAAVIALAQGVLVGGGCGQRALCMVLQWFAGSDLQAQCRDLQGE